MSHIIVTINEIMNRANKQVSTNYTWTWVCYLYMVLSNILSNYYEVYLV